MMLVFAVFLGHLAKVPSDGLPYPLFAYAALVPWILFAQSVAGASESLVVGSALITKVYFPRLLMPLASVISFLMDFAIALSLLIAMVLYYRIGLTWRLVWLLPVTTLDFAIAAGVGILFAALNVRYRDVKYALPFILQIWLFASPIAYGGSLIPQSWRLVYALNPMATVVQGFRWAVVGAAPPQLTSVLVTVLITCAVLILSIGYFRRVERRFADVI